MNQNDNDILNTKSSRFSDEDRARMVQENEGARLAARRSREQSARDSRKRAEAPVGGKNSTKTEKRSSEKKAVSHSPKGSASQKKNTAPQSGSRNDRVKDSQKERKKTHKRNNNLIISMMFIVAVAVIGIFAALALRVNVIEVSGSERYSDSSVLEAAGLDGNVSMLLLNSAAAERKTETLLPYVEKAEIKRVWPDKLAVTITDAVPVLAIDTGKGYVLMNAVCKVLDDDAVTVGTDTAIIKGVSIQSAVPGKTVEFSGEISLQEFSRLVEAFSEYGIDKITEYDLSMISDISVIIDHRIEVKLGTLAGSSKKLGFGKEVIDKTIASDSRHSMIVDITADGKAYVRDKNDTNVSFDVPPEETTAIVEETTVSEETTAASQPAVG